MVEGIHAQFAEMAIGQDRVPALPDRGRAHLDLIQPAREFVVEQQLVGQIVHTIFRQNPADERCTDKPGLEIVVVLCQFAAQGRCYAGAERLWNEVEMQRNHIGCLGVYRETAR